MKFCVRGQIWDSFTMLNLVKIAGGDVPLSGKLIKTIESLTTLNSGCKVSCSYRPTAHSHEFTNVTNQWPTMQRRNDAVNRSAPLAVVSEAHKNIVLWANAIFATTQRDLLVKAFITYARPILEYNSPLSMVTYIKERHYLYWVSGATIVKWERWNFAWGSRSGTLSQCHIW